MVTVNDGDIAASQILFITPVPSDTGRSAILSYHVEMEMAIMVVLQL